MRGPVQLPAMGRLLQRRRPVPHQDLRPDATWGGEKHAVYAVIDANDVSIYADFAPVATKMIEKARLPLGVESAT